MSYKPGSGSGPGVSGDHLIDTATPGPVETTVALWLRQDAPVSGAGAIANIYLIGDPDNTPHFSVQFYESGRLRLTEFNTNVISTLSVGNGWHRVVYICDITAPNQTQWLYVDGVLFATLTGMSYDFVPAFEVLTAFGNTAPDAANGPYFSWTTVKTLASLDAQWVTPVAIDRTGLWRETPLATDLLDDSGGAHHWQIAQTVTQIADAPDLGYPRVMAVANSNGTTPGAGVALTMPAGIVAGELLLCWATNDAPSTTNMAISGWTLLQNTTAPTTAVKHAIFAKLAVGSDTATLTGAAQDYVATVARIQNHGVVTLATDIKLATASTGTSAAPDPPSLDTGASKKYLWLTSNGADDDDIPTTFPLEPSGFTGLAQVFSATGTTSCMQQVAQRAEEAQTKNPGTFVLAAAEEWAATTIAIPPPAAGTISSSVGATTATSTGTGIGQARAAGIAASAGTSVVTGVSAGAGVLTAVGAAVATSTVTGISPAVSGAPAIAAVSGTLSHGTAITITGTNFGTKSPAAPSVRETFESGTLGSGLNENGAGSAGAVVYTNTTNLRHARTTRHARVNFNVNFDGYGGVWWNTTSGSDTKWFVQYWLRFDTNLHFGTGEPGGDSRLANIKFYRLFPSGPNYTNWGLIDHSFDGSGTHAFNEGDGTSNTYGTATIDLNALSLGVWHCLQIESQEGSGLDTADGILRLWIDGALALNVTTIVTNMSGDGAFKAKFPFIIGIFDSWPQVVGSTTQYIWFDDIHVEQGTWARVEIGNASTYGACTLRELQAPTTWSATSIGLTLQLGALPGGAAWVYVTDAAGARSAGFPVTLIGDVVLGSAVGSAAGTSTAAATGVTRVRRSSTGASAGTSSVVGVSAVLLPIMRSLMAYWPLNEASGAALDAHSVHDLTDHNAVGSTTGTVAGARTFVAASQQYFSLPTHPDVWGGSNFSLSAWVYLASVPANQSEWSLVSKQNDFTGEYDLFVGTYDITQFYLWTSATGAIDSDQVVANQWYHLTAGYDAEAHQAWITVNATAPAVMSAAGVPIPVTSADFRLGHDGVPGAAYHNGRLDEVAFWKKRLSDVEIAWLYNNGAGRSYEDFLAVTADSLGRSTGTSTGLAISKVRLAFPFTTSGVSTAQAQSVVRVADLAIGLAAGSSTAAGVSRLFRVSVGTAAGTSTASAVGVTPTVDIAVGTAAASGTALATGRTGTLVSGIAHGAGTSLGTGVSVTINVQARVGTSAGRTASSAAASQTRVGRLTLHGWVHDWVKTSTPSSELTLFFSLPIVSGAPRTVLYVLAGVGNVSGATPTSLISVELRRAIPFAQFPLDLLAVFDPVIPGGHRRELWVLDNPPPGTHTVILNTSAATWFTAGGIVVSAVHPSLIRGSASTEGTTASPLLTVASDPDDLVLVLPVHSVAGGSVAPGPGVTELWDEFEGLTTIRSAGGWAAGAAPSVVIAHTLTAPVVWSLLAFSVPAFVETCVGTSTGTSTASAEGFSGHRGDAAGFAMMVGISQSLGFQLAFGTTTATSEALGIPAISFREPSPGGGRDLLTSADVWRDADPSSATWRRDGTP